MAEFESKIKHKWTRLMCSKCGRKFDLLLPLTRCTYCGGIVNVTGEQIREWNSFNEIVYYNNKTLLCMIIGSIRYRITRAHDDYIFNCRLNFGDIGNFYMLYVFLKIFGDVIIREYNLLTRIARDIITDNYDIINKLLCRNTIEALFEELEENGMFVIELN